MLALTACATEEEVEKAAAPGLISQPVVGGQTTDACDWPSTVDVNGCTGTLIHPRVVTSAAHCMQGSTGKVTFTAGKGIAGSFSLTGTCKAGARGSSGGGTKNDWAYCVIPDDERVKKFPITPPLVGCEADKFLKVGASGWVVGFGATGSDGNGYGVKRAVEVKINKVQNGIVDIGDKNVGACHGDSGGPIYMKLGDATHDWGYRVFGSTSSAGGNCDCTCSTIYVNIANHVKAIEENEKIDVTPCTDANGAWAPGPDCHTFQSNPQEGTGTYPVCSVPMTSGPIETCGAATGGLPAAGGGALPAAGATAPAAGGLAPPPVGGPGIAGTISIPLAGSAAPAGAPAPGASGTIAAVSGSPASAGTLPQAGAVGAPLAMTTGSAGRGTGTVVSAVGIAGGPAAGRAATTAGVAAPVMAPAPAPAPAKSGCQVLGAGAAHGDLAPLWLGSLGMIGLGLRRSRLRRTRARA